MKKLIYALIIPLVVAGGLVFANRGDKNENSKPIPKVLSAADRKTEREKWEASPDGMKFKEWEASPAGQKVYAAEAKIRKQIQEGSHMEAVVSSLTLPAGSRLGFGVMVRINGEEYILTFDTDMSQREQLKSLEVNDKIMIRSSAVSHAPKYAYPIIICEYAERDGKEIYKRVLPKDGC